MKIRHAVFAVIASLALGVGCDACDDEYYFVCGQCSDYRARCGKSTEAPGPKWECHANVCPAGRYPLWETKKEGLCEASAEAQGGNSLDPPRPVDGTGPQHHDRDNDGVSYPDDIDDDDPKLGSKTPPSSSSSSSSTGGSSGDVSDCDQAWTCAADPQASSYCLAACARPDKTTQMCAVLQQTFPSAVKCCPICANP